jgi:hypothetical protein
MKSAVFRRFLIHLSGSWQDWRTRNECAKYQIVDIKIGRANQNAAGRPHRLRPQPPRSVPCDGLISNAFLKFLQAVRVTSGSLLRIISDRSHCYKTTYMNLPVAERFPSRLWHDVCDSSVSTSSIPRDIVTSREYLAARRTSEKQGGAVNLRSHSTTVVDGRPTPGECQFFTVDGPGRSK